ncbi:MAG: hypothetical protein HQK61_02200 [Desulfamplus sp.]|nr:hypothetical protein [Desulfamplus sp.]
MTLNDRITKFLYIITLTFLTLTGFAQMPIFKRYRIADIPGLGWLAEFYVTHSMHYIFAILLIGLAFYVCVDYFSDRKKEKRPTSQMYAKAVMISGLIITGALLVFKNLPGTPPYSPLIVSMLNLLHLTFCMLLLFYSLIILIIKKYLVQKTINDSDLLSEKKSYFQE